MTIRQFRYLAIAEAATWIALLAAVVAKYGFGVDGATSTMGPIHGVVFLAYLFALLALRERLGFDARRTAVSVGAALLPLGTYLFVERRLPRGSDQ